MCLEDIDQYIHPRLLRQLVELLDEITEDRNTQIIATTHNTHVVDVFKDNEYAVIIVEKTNGETQFVSFAERMNHFEIEDDDSLGGLWYAGFVGGYTYPERRNSR
ncbi:MAG: AAA family ATPase [Chloroflexota bacterium]